MWTRPLQCSRLANLELPRCSAIRRHWSPILTEQAGKHHAIGTCRHSGGNIEERVDSRPFLERPRLRGAGTAGRRPLEDHHPAVVDLSLEPTLTEVVLERFIRRIPNRRFARAAPVVFLPVRRDRVGTRRAAATEKTAEPAAAAECNRTCE